jgi:radical SAM-linked protein
MQESSPVRMRITFAKTDAMRFIGHLDLHRAWERSFRRAGLPLAYSQGFNPRPRLNLASALPLGFTSRAEVIDAWLEENILPETVAQALEGALPPGIKVVHIENVALRAPTLQAELEASEFLITFLDPVGDLSGRVHDLLAAQRLPRRRRKKEYDLRPLILSVKLICPGQSTDVSPDNPQLLVILSAREGATGRPEELVEVMGIDPLTIRVERTRLIFHAI